MFKCLRLILKLKQSPSKTIYYKVSNFWGMNIHLALSLSSFCTWGSSFISEEGTCLHTNGCLTVYSVGWWFRRVAGEIWLFALDFPSLSDHGGGCRYSKSFSQPLSIACHIIERNKNRKKNRWSQLRRREKDNYLMGGRDSWEKMLFPNSVFIGAQLRGEVEPRLSPFVYILVVNGDNGSNSKGLSSENNRKWEVNRKSGDGEKDMALWFFLNKHLHKRPLNLRKSKQLEQILAFLRSLIGSTFTQQLPWMWKHCRMCKELLLSET